MKTPQGPEICEKGSLQSKGGQACPSTSYSEVKTLGGPRRNERKTVQTLEMGQRH